MFTFAAILAEQELGEISAILASHPFDQCDFV